MTKTQNIRILFLSLVYLVLLFSVVVPHHHHEETACFTTTHCDDDFQNPSKHTDDFEDHHHDHKAGAEAEHCISVEYYITSYVSKSIKRVIDFPIPENDYFLAINKLSCMEGNEVITTDFKLHLFPLDNTFTVFLKHELPLRGPPSYLA